MQPERPVRIPEEGELVRADLRTLIISTLALLACIAGGFALLRHSIQIGDYAMDAARFGREEAIVQLVGLIRISSGIATLGSLPAGIYIIWIAALTIRRGVYPPPGVRLPVSVMARRGQGARAKAMRMAALSLLLIGLAAANYLIVPDMLLRIFLKP